MGFELCRCTGCGHRYAAEAFEASTLSESYYQESEVSFDQRSMAAKSARYANEYVKLLEKHGTGSGRVLDVGCNAGELLSLFQRDGWDVAGIEVSSAPAAYAKQRLKCPIWVGAVEQVLPADERFDLVTMTHVLEHLMAPLAVLTRLRDMLTPDAGMLLIEVPNADDWLLPLWRGYYRPLCPGDHISFFDGGSLGEILRRSGFSLLEILAPTHAHDILYPGLLSTIDTLKARLRPGASERADNHGVLAQTRYRGRWREPARSVLDATVRFMDPLAASLGQRFVPGRGAALVALAKPLA